MAHKAGKPVLLDEEWLYKIGPGEREGIATSERVFERDLRSFWTPLDRRFFESVGAFVQTEGVIYVSPFWSHLYFASLPYDAALDAGGYREATARFQPAVTAAILKPGVLSPLGQALASLISPPGRQ